MEDGRDQDENIVVMEKPMECSDIEEDSSKPVSTHDCQAIFLIGNFSQYETALTAAQKLCSRVECINESTDLSNNFGRDTVFVLSDFSGPLFNLLKENNQRILGPIALQELAEKGEGIPVFRRPVYCLSMYGIVLCFTGFRVKEELAHLLRLVHNMGASVRGDMSSQVTHLIANSCMGDKYQYAAIFRLPIASVSWVHHSWAMRDQTGYQAVSDLAEHRLKVFHGARVCFIGFTDDECQHMSEILTENGGVVTDLADPACTHVVIDESDMPSAPAPLPPKALLVKAEWFWSSVQKEFCVDEQDHLFLETVGNTTPRISISSGPGSSRARKRKRLRANLSKVMSPVTGDPGKRRSSISDAALLSCSGSFLDASPLAPESEGECPETPSLKNLSARRQVFLELVQTESNYVGILNTIMTLFKGPLEDMLEEEDPLLNATELKIIFGNLPPIYQTHCAMLEELKYAAQNWNEEVSIGNIILKFSGDLVKAYPPFVNFFEATREMLVKCDEQKPRFHAFLKARQTRAECGRQTLVELLIRPVQRLPSISLLLTDILKHTSKSNPDHRALDQALNSIREVMTYINEDKRKTDGQVVMFDIFNDIDNCPPHLVSSHRSFIARCEVTELSDSLSGRGDSLVLYLFTDVLEVCKKRSKAFNSLKSPNASAPGKFTNSKPYKHIKLISLSIIRRVFDIKETEVCHKVFSVMIRSTEDLKEKLYHFTITDEEVDKLDFLKKLCRQIANNACRPDAEGFLATVDPKNVDIETSEVGLGTLGKAFKFASRTRIKVTRAFSFNKTPSKLKRAVSTMMSPFGSTTNLTPAAAQLAQMRLASCTNISELAGNNSPPVAQYVAPLSVQPTRRAKHSSLSVASLRRL